MLEHTIIWQSLPVWSTIEGKRGGGESDDQCDT